MSETAPAQTPEKDGAAVRIPPPLVFLGLTLVGALIQRFGPEVYVPMDLEIRYAAAGVLAATSIALMVTAFGKFKATGQDPKPWKPTPEIIASGIYRYTRNPMYISMTLLQLAIGVGFMNGWICILAPLALTTVYYTAVRHEEAYLERKFGESYLSYKRSVRRWV